MDYKWSKGLVVMFVSVQLHKYNQSYMYSEINSFTFIERISELQRKGQMSGNGKTHIKWNLITAFSIMIFSLLLEN